ncbi:MAG: CsgG/HfaB family protein [Candidatus Omnitrophica bacterium]|nr:CsgG/HfaB family protein [Candidatus Omnitrophota bacterium]
MKNYYKIFLICGLLFLFSYPVYALESGIENVSPLISKTIHNLGIKTIAVIDFTNLKGHPTNLGRFIAEELSASLANSSDKFNVIDRIYMDALIKKNGLQVSDFINPSTAVTAAQKAGVETILTGTVLPLSDSVKVFVRIISTSTGKILADFDFNLDKNKTIESLLTAGQGIKTITPSGSPSKPPAIQIQESYGFFFALTKCELTNSGVTCNLTITNHSNPDNMFIILSAKAVDAYGNIYPASTATMNGTNVSSDGEGNFGSLSTNSNLFSVNANQGVPIKSTLVFNNVNFTIKKISMLEITFSAKQQQNMGNLTVTMQENPYTVKFENIPFTRQNE